MKPWLFVVNSTYTLAPEQSTAHLMLAAVTAGAPVWVCAIDFLEAQPDGRVTALAHPISARAETARSVVRSARETKRRRVELDEFALAMVRTNPGRDPRPMVHHAALDLLAMAASRGLPVLNRPAGLARARTKLYLHQFPIHCRPETLVTASPDDAQAFISSLSGQAVIKPLVGTQGRDVFLLDQGALPNLNALLDVVLRDGPAMIQARVITERPGDTRILVMDGEVVTVDGKHCAVHRIPQGDEFRSNRHVGALAAPPNLEKYHLEVVEAVGPTLRADGLFLVGLDTVGDKVIECNVFAPGGLQDAEGFGGVDFAAAIVAGALRHAREAGRA